MVKVAIAQLSSMVVRQWVGKDFTIYCGVLFIKYAYTQYYAKLQKWNQIYINVQSFRNEMKFISKSEGSPNSTLEVRNSLNLKEKCKFVQVWASGSVKNLTHTLTLSFASLLVLSLLCRKPYHHRESFQCYPHCAWCEPCQLLHLNTGIRPSVSDISVKLNPLFHIHHKVFWVRSIIPVSVIYFGFRFMGSVYYESE